MRRLSARAAGAVSPVVSQRRRLAHAGALLLLGTLGAGPFQAPAAAAAPATDAQAWLVRASAAARTASYSGVYVYTCAGITETARVTRLRNASGDAERIESLDGTRREVVRRGDEIHYFFVDSKTVRVDRRVSGRSFPDFLPQDPSTLAAYYSIEVGPVDRAAGRAVQVIRLRARDGSRYTQEVWADQQSGLPVKRRVIDERGDIIEQFVFTELSVGERLSPRHAMPSRRTGYAGWTVENSSVEEARQPGAGPLAQLPAKGGDAAPAPFPEPRMLPPGFRKVIQVSRTLPGHDRPVMQSVYSDGLATLSVFVDPDVARVAGHEGISQRGAVGVITRAAGDRAVITVGEVPAATLRKVADSIGPLASR
ncbi:MAG: MucB/RseB C-terminal domain-containing protein [Rhodocyclaceae bacterium]|jgi:sigma-E factor negative regulatory protein RseB|nr:MucB/RseB C-terminal domain-containing protein [Rhodocyclaceae bacterium]MCE2978511.1 MucB/RseB C-terminal domain-containing protein [Betaproteobacteria bacterium]MCA3073684.1 MucB/RseB C-terminal domain-containing protein [Rhodocyclaceae bacterium]MCA3088959.1 MucB/RseB C-terminal domain-containing protein [Rhodocyclaceae bacterium]MCA3095695.1 MucB/RseB C-terminal domain-containing protein [Rhodocyclaceae bacterium]